MQRQLYKHIRVLPVYFLLLCLVFVAACSNGAPKTTPVKSNTPVPTRSATQPPTGSQTSGQVQPGRLSPISDRIALAVLNNIRKHGWNPLAQTKGAVTGGLFVNWEMTNPQHTNALKGGSNDATSDKHDPQTDLYYLNALAEYTVLHPQDHAFRGEISKMSGLILQEFSNYNLPKGWLYFYILRDGLLLHNDGLVNVARTIASNYYDHWYDSSVGLVYNRSHSPGVVTPEQSMTAGAALINAGMRWHQDAWVQAGKSTIATITQHALDRSASLFYEGLTVTGGSFQVVNPQAKPATQGAIAEALVKAYDDTHDQQYLSLAERILGGIFNSDLVDRQNGGLYFAKNLQTGQLQKDYKETRSHTIVLIAMNTYNNALRARGQAPRFQSEVQEFYKLLTQNFYQSQYHGYFYRMTPNYHVYVSAAGKGIGYEDFFTTEAMGTALDALQQLEIANLPV